MGFLGKLIAAPFYAFGAAAVMVSGPAGALVLGVPSIVAGCSLERSLSGSSSSTYSSSSSSSYSRSSSPSYSRSSSSSYSRSSSSTYSTPPSPPSSGVISPVTPMEWPDRAVIACCGGKWHWVCCPRCERVLR